MTGAAVLVALLASAPGEAQLLVSIGDGAYADAVAAGLTRELPEARIVEDAREADLRVLVDEEGDQLAVSVTTADGAAVLARQIPIVSQDPRPALRVTILLLAQTARSYARERDGPDPEERPAAPSPDSAASPPLEPASTATASAPAPPTQADAPRPGPSVAPSPTETSLGLPMTRSSEPASFTGAAGASPEASTATTTPAARPKWLVIPAGFTVGGWLRPATPLIGFFGGVGARFDRWTTSVRAEVAGLLCCRLSDRRFDGSALEIALLAEARYRLLRLGAVDFAAAAAAGAAYVQVDGRPDDDPGFPVSLTEQRRSTWDPQGRLALGLEWPLWPDRLLLSVYAGVQLRGDRLVVDLPARTGEPLPLDAGPVLPWFGLGVLIPIL